MFLFKLSRRLYTLSFALPLCWLRLPRVDGAFSTSLLYLRA
ncbi:Hypothetical protein ABZS17G119_03558 [Kosakonia cowanii]